MPTLQIQPSYELSAGVRCTSNEDGGVALDINQGQMYRLNYAGAIILQFLGNGSTESQIAREIAQRFEIGEELALQDVYEFLKSLEQTKLVRARK
jgi:hypothetical protein